MFFSTPCRYTDGKTKERGVRAAVYYDGLACGLDDTPEHLTARGVRQHIKFRHVAPPFLLSLYFTQRRKNSAASFMPFIYPTTKTTNTKDTNTDATRGAAIEMEM